MMTLKLSNDSKFFLVLIMGMLLGSPIASVANEMLGYDLKGNIISRQNDMGSTTYQYDNLGRLTNEQGPQATQSFTYDANGNRLTDGGGSYVYTPNSNVMTSEHGNPVVHDAAGNLIDNGQGLTFEYNQAGRLKRVFDNSILVATYVYNSFGQRTRKVTPGGTTVYHYDLDGQLIEETLNDGTPQTSYIWRNNKPTSVIYAPGTPSNSGAQEKAVYLHTDHLNTPRKATDEAGTDVWQWESDAFGSTVTNNDPDNDGSVTVVNLRFPGQYADAESGLYYNWYRYYEPDSGRFLSNDPLVDIEPLTHYSYVGQNPLQYIDTDGRERLNMRNMVSNMSKVDTVNDATRFISQAIENGQSYKEEKPIDLLNSNSNAQNHYQQVMDIYDNRGQVKQAHELLGNAADLLYQHDLAELCENIITTAKEGLSKAKQKASEAKSWALYTTHQQLGRFGQWVKKKGEDARRRRCSKNPVGRECSLDTARPYNGIRS